MKNIFQNEVWSPIIGFEEYEASNKGRIRELRTGKLLHQIKNHKGYFHVRVKKNNGEPMTLNVHRAVLFAFKYDEYEDGLTVNHIDENRANNNLENLEWLSNADNIRYSQGIKVKCIETGKEYNSIWSASRDTGVACLTIRNNLKNKLVRTKRSKFSWEYVEEAI